eukprot:252066_1
MAEHKMTKTSVCEEPKWRGKHDLKVIGAGFSRTGSYSLKMALEELGFTPCWHIIDIMCDDDKANALMWWRNMNHRLKMDKKSVDFDEFYGELANGAQAAVDWPTFFYWEEIAEYYPNCKLILTVRDKERWYSSCIMALNLYFYNPLWRFLVWFRLIEVMHFIATELVPKSVEEFGGMNKFYNDKQHVFNHIDQRIKYMTTDKRYKNRVLIFKVKDGWAELCKFLNVDIPNIPFPRSNDGAALARNTSRFVWQNIKRILLNHTFLVLVLIFIAIVGFNAMFF